MGPRATLEATPTWPRVSAPPSWSAVDFISDLHLHAGEPETFLAWQHYMEHSAAQAVFILGDLFEVWVGDDGVDEAVPRVAHRADERSRAGSAKWRGCVWQKYALPNDLHLLRRKRMLRLKVNRQTPKSDAGV